MRPAESTGLMIDLRLGRLDEDIGGTYLVWFAIAVLRAEHEMSVPLAIPTDKGHENTRPGFLLPVQKPERSPAGSVDERVFRQIAGSVEAVIASSSLRLPVVARTVNILLSWINQDC